jgi:hypothetical protein
MYLTLAFLIYVSGPVGLPYNFTEEQSSQTGKLQGNVDLLHIFAGDSVLQSFARIYPLGVQMSS